MQKKKEFVLYGFNICNQHTIKYIKMHIFIFLSHLKVLKIESGWEMRIELKKKRWLHFFLCNSSSTLNRLYANYGFVACVVVISKKNCSHLISILFLSLLGKLNRVVMMPYIHQIGCALFEIIQYEGYNENRFRHDLKLLFTQIGIQNKRTVVLFSIINDQVREPIKLCWNTHFFRDNFYFFLHYCFFFRRITSNFRL